jgi:HEPN domain-containing protein
MKHQVIKSSRKEDRTESDVFSWDLEDLGIPQKYFHMAKAYLDSSKTLFCAMIADSQPATFSHAQAATLLFEHGLELFLKGTLWQAGRNPGNTHDLAGLRRQFRNLYPGKKYEFTAQIDEAVKEHPNQPHMEWTRYPIDQNGKVWRGSSHFTLELWKDQMEAFRKDFDRLIPLIEARKKSCEPAH